MERQRKGGDGIFLANAHFGAEGEQPGISQVSVKSFDNPLAWARGKPQHLDSHLEKYRCQIRIPTPKIENTGDTETYRGTF